MSVCAEYWSQIFPELVSTLCWFDILCIGVGKFMMGMFYDVYTCSAIH